MKYLHLKGIFAVVIVILIAINFNCSSSDNGEKDIILPGQDLSYLTVDSSSLTFDDTMLNDLSSSKFFAIEGLNLDGDVKIKVQGPFLLSSESDQFVNEITIPQSTFDNTRVKIIHVFFNPQSVGNHEGEILISVPNVENHTVKLSGKGIQKVINVQAFNNSRHAFGNGLSQSQTQIFSMPDDLSKVEKINMFIQLKCPSGGCNIWDVYANVLIKDPISGEFLEMGRYITPYGKSTAQLPRGFEIDVTDFKSLLTGNVELKSYVEVWGSDGWLVSVDFDFIEGTPDYQYYQIVPVVQYNKNSLEGVIYGEDASAFDLTKSIQIPSNTQVANFRTIITGWGHATPLDSGNRGCAEWCFRTHHIKINGANTFQHALNSLGCANNPIQPQSGNWNQNRAGWCPGMAVPVRVDNLSNNVAGQTLNFEYALQPWTNNLQANIDNPHAYYAISTFVVVKSNTPIEKPVVNN